MGGNEGEGDVRFNWHCCNVLAMISQEMPTDWHENLPFLSLITDI